MAVNKMALTVGLLITALFIIPASAMAAGGTISGKVDFPAASSFPENVTETTTNLTVSDLTIYAVNIQTGFANVTNPNPDGTYQIPVTDDGLYQIYVKPDAIADTSRGPDFPQIVQYPNREGTRVYVVNMQGKDITNADIKGYAPGYYQPPNDLTLTSDVPAATDVTIPQTSPTAAPTPGFVSLIALAGMIIAAAAILQRKN
ncbi:hypothetical protein [Methanocella arvoryzae]|uniref:Uncharacterized protein n=1 Tax=Methanocella arvoryzae (strain DSM 22066 / NBRC 105507 / MRE50) TaxID=351160 RepID=Q0W8L9_METAR|nr:hypothetical protein [Methanocella arvoryzae]CAH04811.1 hypothetical protein orf11 [uncultured archaeon]CAJ35274.1 hypothetical protein LRC300 [Methanocella arvoryzae MRE50]